MRYCSVMGGCVMNIFIHNATRTRNDSDKQSVAFARRRRLVENRPEGAWAFSFAAGYPIVLFCFYFFSYMFFTYTFPLPLIPPHVRDICGDGCGERNVEYNDETFTDTRSQTMR